MMAGLDLPSQAEVDAAMACEAYDVAPFNPTVPRADSFRNYLGGWQGPNGAPTLHNVVHSWTGGAWDSDSYRFYPVEVDMPATDKLPAKKLGPGWDSYTRSYVGTMQALQTSANDPVFFIHHSNVDRLWAEWQAKDGNAGLNGYVSAGATGLKDGWGPDDEIAPFAALKEVPEMTRTGITNASMLDISALDYQYES
jgi:tyrosinase